MADIEEKVVLTVDTGNSTKTVKGLKDEIAKLKDTILNLDKGTDDYHDAVKQLQEDQRQLNEIMSLTKKEAVALDGSYDALVFKMAQLKKEWKATNDEAKRAELGKEIDEINSQLKDMDSSIGNFQRNVGNYKEDAVDAFKAVKDEIKEARAALLQAEEGTEEYTAAMSKLANAQFQLRDINEASKYAVEDFGEQLGNVAGITSGLVAGFSAFQAAMVLAGKDGEKFQEIMVKLQASMALVQGLQGLEGMTKRVAGLSKVLSTMMKTMGKAGWIGLILTAVAALTTLIVTLNKKRKAMNDGIMTQKEYNKAIKEAYTEELKSTAEQIALLEVLYRMSTDTSIVGAYKLREKAAKALCEQLKIEANQINVNALMAEKYAEKQDNLNKTTFTFAKAVEGAVSKMMEQAKASALLDFISQKYEEILVKSWELVEAQKEGTTAGDKWTTVWLNMMRVADPKIASGPMVKVDDVTKGRIEGLKNEIKGLETEVQEFIERMINNSDLSGLLASLIPEPEKEGWDELANKELQALDAIYNRRVEYAKITKKTEEEQAKDVYNINLEWSAKRKEIINSYIEKAKEVPLNQQQLNTLESMLLDENLKTAQTYYDERKRLQELDKENREKALASLNNVFQTEIDGLEHKKDIELRANQITLESDEEKAKKASEINAEYADKELQAITKNLDELLKLQEEWSKKGFKITDEHKNQIIELTQLKADKEIEIEENKYDELLRLRKQHRDNESKQLETASFDYNIASRKNRVSDDPTTDNDDADREKKAYEITLEYLNKKKQLLTEFRQSAFNDGETEATLEYERQIAETEIEIEEAKYAELERLRQADLDAKQKKLDEWNKYLGYAATGLETVGNIMDAVYQNMYASAQENGEISEEEAKKLKGIQKAQAWISALMGAVQAFAGAMQLGPIAGPIVGGINAAAVMAMGAANVKMIDSTDMTGKISTSTTAIIPHTSSYQSELPFTYTKQVTGAQETDTLNQQQNIRVVLVESDVEESMNRIKTRVSETSF